MQSRFIVDVFIFSSQVLNPTWIYLFKPQKDSLIEKEKKNLKTADKEIKTITKIAKVLCLKWKVFEILKTLTAHPHKSAPLGWKDSFKAYLAFRNIEEIWPIQDIADPILKE